jgi:hypothetical protein
MPPLRLSELMSTSVATLRGNLTAFLLFATLAAMASQVVIQGLGFAELVSAPVDPSTIEPSLGLAARLFLTSSLLIVLYAFAAGAILFGAVRFLDNDPATHGDCVGMGLKRVPALVGLGMILALLAGLASSVLGVIGGAFMIVPMTILGVLAVSVLFVAAPVLVLEETGIIAAMRRSADLTKGARMTLLGALGVILCASVAVNALVLIAISGVTWIDAAIMAAADAAIIAFGTVIMAVAYHELRGRKHGVGATAGVFD